MRVPEFVDQLSQEQFLLLRSLVEEVKHVTHHLLPHLLRRVVGRRLHTYNNILHTYTHICTYILEDFKLP